MKLGRRGEHTSFRESIAGNELSNSVTSSPPPPPSKSSSPSSTNAALSLPVANWFASSPSNAFSRVRKSSASALSKPELPWACVCAVREGLVALDLGRERGRGISTAGVELLEGWEAVGHFVLWLSRLQWGLLKVSQLGLLAIMDLMSIPGAKRDQTSGFAVMCR
jgi:hypothetical protein